LTVTQYNNIIK